MNNFDPEDKNLYVRDLRVIPTENQKIFVWGEGLHEVCKNDGRGAREEYRTRGVEKAGTLRGAPAGAHWAPTGAPPPC